MKSAVATTLLALFMPAAHALELLVPAYFYPVDDGSSYWQSLTDSAPGVGITAPFDLRRGGKQGGADGGGRGRGGAGGAAKPAN